MSDTPERTRRPRNTGTAVRVLLACGALIAAGYAAGQTTITVDSATIVSNAGADQTYGWDELIRVQVRFSEAVEQPDGAEPVTFRLDVGDVVRRMPLADGLGTRVLEFRYRVTRYDLDRNGVSWRADALFGELEPADGSTRTVDNVGSEPDDLAHQVDGVRPAATAVRVTNLPQANNTYGLGEDINITVTFDEIVHVHSPCDGGDPPDLVLLVTVGGQTRQARLVDGSGTNALRFRYTVQIGDRDDDGISIGRVPGRPSPLYGGCIQDGAGNVPARSVPDLRPDLRYRVDGGGPEAPVVTAVTIESSPDAGTTYGLGEDIEVDVTFNEDVHVSGQPVLALSVGARAREATFVRGSGSMTLRFRYTVQIGDKDGDGISIGSDALQGGTIVDAAGNAAVRSFTALPADGDHKVDGGGSEAPVVREVTIESTPAAGDTYGRGEDIRVKVTFNEDVHVTGDPVLVLSVGARLSGGRVRRRQRDDDATLPLHRRERRRERFGGQHRLRRAARGHHRGRRRQRRRAVVHRVARGQGPQGQRGRARSPGGDGGGHRVDPRRGRHLRTR